MKYYLNVLAIFCLPFISKAQVHNFSVTQSVDYAMKNATEVKNALLDIKIQKQKNREITSAALPQLNGNITISHNLDIPVQSIPNFISPATYQVLVQEGVKDGNGNPIAFPAEGFGNLAFPFGTPWTASAGADLSQLLFDGQVFIGLQARSASIKYITAQSEVTKEQIAVNVQKIYFQLVVAKQQMSSLTANIDRAEKLLNDTREIYNNGFAERLDVDKVNVQLNNLITEKLKLENQIASGNAGLKLLMNMPQSDTLNLTDTLTDENIKDGLLDEAYDYKNRKEFQMFEAAKKLGNFNVRRYKLSYLPTVAFFGNYSKSAQREEFDFFNKGTWFTGSTIGLQIKVPIFDGFGRAARVAQAKLELEKINNQSDQLKGSIDNDVKQARLKIKTAILTMDNQKRNMQLAEEVYNSTVLKYEQGLGSNQEIYNAQAELKVAQNNYYSSFYDAIIARIDYLKATGKL